MRINRTLYSVMLILFAAMLGACNFDMQEATPTVEGIEEPINPIGEPPTVTATVTILPTASPTESPLIGAPLATWTPVPPTLTITPSPTLGPYEHRVESGESLSIIAQRYGYNNPAVFREILRLNPQIPNENSLPVGQVILIPRMTDTPTPQGFDVTATALATRGIELPRAISENTTIDCHVVEANETIISIASEYNTTIEILSSLNREIIFNNCDFNIRSGGANCSVLLQVGQCVRVPFPTPTPTSSPTPSGSETPTPTPTYAAPQVISPPEGWTVRGSLRLEWVSTQVLLANEFYYVDVLDTVTGQTYQNVTKETSMALPASLIPPAGASHRIEWRVTVARRDDGGNFSIVGADRVRSFTWAG